MEEAPDGNFSGKDGREILSEGSRNRKLSEWRILIVFSCTCCKDKLLSLCEGVPIGQ